MKNKKASMNKQSPLTRSDIESIINAAMEKAFQSGRVQTVAEVKDTYKATEKRLYALPTLLLKVEDDKSWIEEIKTFGAPERSNSVARFGASGVRLTDDEIVEALIKDKKADIAADEHEIAIMNNALDLIKTDSYYEIIPQKYFDVYSDDKIAEFFTCDPSTVRRNKSRLIQRLAVYLYGSRVVS